MKKIYLAWRSVWLEQYHVILDLSTVSKGDVIDIYIFFTANTIFRIELIINLLNFWYVRATAVRMSLEAGEKISSLLKNNEAMYWM